MTDRSEGASWFSFFARHLRIALGVAMVVAGASGRLEGQSYRRVADINPGVWSEERGRVCGSVNGPVSGEFAGVLLADGRGSGCDASLEVTPSSRALRRAARSRSDGSRNGLL